MLLIDCPNCGPRDEVEYHYGGQAHVAYPENPDVLTDREWAEYLFYRENPKGAFAERWQHSAGCRKERTMTASRLSPAHSPGHGIDRDDAFTFTLDGVEVHGFDGDTVASASIADDRIACGPSLYLARARGILTAGVEELNALLHVSSQQSGSRPPRSGRRRRRVRPPSRAHRRPRRRRRTSGLAAAREAAKTGARVLLMDEQPLPGGSLLSSRPGSEDGEIDEQDSVSWASASIDRLDGYEEFTYLPRTTAIGSYDSNYVIAVERRTAHLPAAERERLAASGVSRQRVWHVRAQRVVLATGSHERPIVFANNDRPGIMLAGAVRTYLNRYAVAAGSRVVVATTNDAAYALVEDLIDAELQVAAVVDSRPEASPRAAAVLVGRVFRASSAPPSSTPLQPRTPCCSTPQRRPTVAFRPSSSRHSTPTDAPWASMRSCTPTCSRSRADTPPCCICTRTVRVVCSGMPTSQPSFPRRPCSIRPSSGRRTARRVSPRRCARALKRVTSRRASSGTPPRSSFRPGRMRLPMQQSVRSGWSWRGASLEVAGRRVAHPLRRSAARPDGRRCARATGAGMRSPEHIKRATPRSRRPTIRARPPRQRHGRQCRGPQLAGSRCGRHHEEPSAVHTGAVRGTSPVDDAASSFDPARVTNIQPLACRTVRSSKTSDS
ncbi:Sarcosine oxidase subunit alpha, partial [Eumeta japonica]